jgi:hypothetical protein
MNFLGGRGPAGTGIRNSAGSQLSQMTPKAPKGYRAGTFQNFSPEAMQLYQQLFQHVSPESNLAQLAGGEEGAFAQTEAPAWRNFQQATGDLASRFSGMGMGARRGSGFQNASSQATSDFAMQLASQRQQLQRQALLDLLGISESLLGQRPSEQFLVPKQKKQSFLQSLMGGLAPGIGHGIGSLFGGLF